MSINFISSFNNIILQAYYRKNNIEVGPSSPHSLFPLTSFLLWSGRDVEVTIGSIPE